MPQCYRIRSDHARFLGLQDLRVSRLPRRMYDAYTSQTTRIYVEDMLMYGYGECDFGMHAQMVMMIDFGLKARDSVAHPAAQSPASDIEVLVRNLESRPDRPNDFYKVRPLVSLSLYCPLLEV